MSRETSWLPPGLELVALRMARADGATFEIGTLALGWSGGEDGPLRIVQVERSGGRHDLVVESIRPIPPLISMLFSEAINHIRSAIENCLFYLVQVSRGSPLPERQAKRVSLPVYADRGKFQDWLQENDRRGVPELGVGSVLAARIESVQPFQDPTTIPSIADPLALIMGVIPDRVAPLVLLQGYSNGDKHRAIRVGAARSSIQVAGKPFDTSDKRMLPIEAGQVIASTASGERIEVDTSTAVHVERPAGAVWVGPVRELDWITNHVSQVVLPTLVKGIALTEPFPLGIDLGDNGLSCRERIEAGRWPSAFDRVSESGMTAFLESLHADPIIPPTQNGEPTSE